MFETASGQAGVDSVAAAPWILVIEDDVDIRESLEELLSEAGYRVRVAADGLQALAVLGAGATPTLILLDLMMPNMDGVGFRSRQLEDPRLRDVPVILLTADSRPTPLDYLPSLRKPFDWEDLLGVVATVLGSQETPVAAPAPLA